ncbi:Uncharacterised protein [Corynebacterium matruchotii]|uniref:Uncharacterized protein n=1 Tax=Corynebacterium matruchotii TaxID=43768 RepID=A0A8B4H0E1_9CORY|nr:Uncharacterised protein [Corynebacterium matruchotii]VEI97963.1 Uncharacterised protein [Corynebacterium matruchotii]
MVLQKPSWRIHMMPKSHQVISPVGSHPLVKSINCLRLSMSQHSYGTLFLSLGAAVG